MRHTLLTAFVLFLVVGTIVGAYAGAPSSPGLGAINVNLVGGSASGDISGTYGSAIEVNTYANGTSFGTMAHQAASGVAITGGTVNNTPIGGTTAAAGKFTTLQATTAGVIVGTTNTPADNAACTAGTLWWDASYLYLCTVSGTVKRAALATY